MQSGGEGGAGEKDEREKSKRAREGTVREKEKREKRNSGRKGRAREKKEREKRKNARKERAREKKERKRRKSARVGRAQKKEGSANLPDNAGTRIRSRMRTTIFVIISVFVVPSWIPFDVDSLSST